MTMLEKMADEMYAALMKPYEEGGLDGWLGDDTDMTYVVVDGYINLPALARAALLAIREPDEAMLKYCAWDRADGTTGPTSEVAEWQSGIDAILAEKPQ